jgi:hypothetical protein
VKAGDKNCQLLTARGDLPTLKAAQPELVAEYEATRQRAAGLKLAKLGL